MKSAMLIGGMMALPALAATASESTATRDPIQTHLDDVPDGKITVERKDDIVLLGINRPQIQNRLDPEAFNALAQAYYDYDHDPSLRAAVLFGHGEQFSQGIDVNAFKALAGTGKPLLSGDNVTDLLGKTDTPHLTKPLIVVVHGDTWNKGGADSVQTNNKHPHRRTTRR